MSLSFAFMNSDRTLSPPRRQGLFSRTPPLTLRQVFRGAGGELGQHGTILLHQGRGRNVPAIEILPFCSLEQAANFSAPEPTHLCYLFKPETSSILIRRIFVEEIHRKEGLATAMLASQYDFWRALGVRQLAVSTHDMAEGFYARLGFQPTTIFPEDPVYETGITALMRLDLGKPEQKGRFEEALRKYPASRLRHINAA